MVSMWTWDILKTTAAKQGKHNNQLRDINLLPMIDINSDDNDDVVEVEKTHAQKGGNKKLDAKTKRK